LLEARLATRDVKKTFGVTAALGGVSFSAAAGEVHALLGENGAGKSTLMKILAGDLGPDSGELFLDGTPYRPKDPMQARRAGVAMVHQELSLCPHLTVAENIQLGVEPATFGILRRTEMRARTEEALGTIVVGSAAEVVHPEARVGDLPPAAAQLVEIARAVAAADCRVLILDEPTSSLSTEDAERLFAVIGKLRGRGLAIIYISHFLEEVQRVADVYTVLRDGKTVAGGPVRGTPLSDMVTAMVGRRIDQLFPRSPRTPGEPMLVLDEVSGMRKPIGASLSLRRGEVLGIAGLVGAGRTELLRAVFGLDRVVGGKVRVGAFEGTGSPGGLLGRGVGMLSEDRKGEGLAASLSLSDNLTLSKLTGLGPWGTVLPRAQQKRAQKFIAELEIRATDTEQKVRDLSGGNQQKVALARLLHHDVDVFLLDEPTRGIDVASKAQIYEIIDALARRGKAILMVSSYLPELLGVCDRIAVMRRGRLGPARAASELSEHALLTEATGA
jgi:ribose transport system ATP-binding protein